MTRADELLLAYRTLGAPREEAFVRALAQRAGWGARPTSAPLLPSGVSHGVPWELSIATPSSDRRVFVEAQSDPPTPEGYWRAAAEVTAFAAEHGADVALLEELTAGMSRSLPRPARVWHAVAISDEIRWHAYITCPDTPAALALLSRAGGAAPQLRPDDRITIVSLDLAPAPRIKAYVLMPNARPDELPDPDFARAMGAPWWLVAHGTGAMHCPMRAVADPITRTRAVFAKHGLACPPLDDLHYVSFQPGPRITTYYTPRVQR